MVDGNNSQYQRSKCNAAAPRLSIASRLPRTVDNSPVLMEDVVVSKKEVPYRSIAANKTSSAFQFDRVVSLEGLWSIDKE